MTVQLTIVAIGAGLLLGVFLGLISSSRDAPQPANPVVAWGLKITRWITLGYVTFFRGTPLFVQILLVHFALMPVLIHPDGGWLLSGDAAREFRQSHGAFFSGALALTLNAGAYISEIFRAGIQSIHIGQTQAGYSLGFTHPQAMRFIVLPQAFRRMLPALVNEGVTLIKDSSLVSILSISDLFRRGREFASRDFSYFETFTMVAMIYLVITLFLSKLVAWMEEGLRNRGRHH